MHIICFTDNSFIWILLLKFKAIFYSPHSQFLLLLPLNRNFIFYVHALLFLFLIGFTIKIANKSNHHIPKLSRNKVYTPQWCIQLEMTFEMESLGKWPWPDIPLVRLIFMVLSSENLFAFLFWWPKRIQLMQNEKIFLGISKVFKISFIL